MNIIIFGLGSVYQNIKELMNTSENTIVALSDNNKDLWYQTMDNYLIIPPFDILKYEFDIVFITSSFAQEISIRLIELGIPKDKIISYNYLAFKGYDSRLHNLFKVDVALITQLLDAQKELAGCIKRHSDKTLFLSAKQMIHNVKKMGRVDNFEDVEFQVFSQFGEDGIIQYLIHNVCIQNKVFVEFGVENYEEANTRFLLMNNNWSGLVIDGDRGNVEHIKAQEYYWKHDLKAICAFITAENINQLIKDAGIEGDIGLLSIDIDGNDYWIWKEIDVISPRIVICEYNSIFGSEHQVTIPYRPDFVRTKAHYSNLYFGASLAALCDLAEQKGYYFVGSNTAGNNAFFVRKDVIEQLLPVSCKQGYVISKFRESRDENGNLTFLSGNQRINSIQDCDIYNLENKKLMKIKELFS